MVVAQLIPPAAFQMANDLQGILFTPASQATQIRRTGVQRPKNTALGPRRSK